MIGEVSPIAAIAGIDMILPIAAIPRVVQPVAGVGGFRLADLPPNVQQAFRKAGNTAWRDAARIAVAEGITDPKTIADVIFFMLHPERMSGDVGKLIDPKEEAFIKVRAEWELYFTIAQRLLKPSMTPDVFLPERASRKYEEFVAKRTTGKVTLMVHGRNWDGTGKFRDVTDTYDRMQEVVDSLAAGDVLYIANWQFSPWQAPIPANAKSLTRSWRQLLTEKALAGVTIRVIIAQQPFLEIPLIGLRFNSPFMTDLKSVNTVIKDVPDAQRDNFKYLVSSHPDKAGVHHQKFMVARKGKSTVAFCGGLDLSNRTPLGWNSGFVWHDVGAKLEGLIAHDFERQFVDLWNRDRTSATTLLPGWKPLEKLTVASATSDDRARPVNPQPVQMWRTVSRGPQPKETQRDDIWRGYFRVIGRATRFLYLENQYFYEPALADAILRQVRSAPGMIVMIVSGTGSDDTTKVTATDLVNRAKERFLADVAQNQFALRLEFFQRLQPLWPAQLRVYTLTYEKGITHTKLILGDDEVLSVGSANANPRGFFTDTEVNFVLDDAKTVRDFRERLWAHNLGLPVAEVAKWNLGDFFARWDAVAKRNAAQPKPEKVVGEGVIPFLPWDKKDKRYQEGKRGPVFGLGDAPEGMF